MTTEPTTHELTAPSEISDFGEVIPKNPRRSSKRRSDPLAPPVPREKKPPVFRIYRCRKDGVFFLARKGDTAYRRLMTFPTVGEARDFRRSPGSYDLLEGVWHRIKEETTVTDTLLRRPENRPRAGTDWLNGKNASPESFQAAFRPFGVQFGKWQDDRHAALNAAYEAFMDLGHALEIKPEDLFFDAQLGLAFGARGHGFASAHYEPTHRVINLTKTRGAGCLAHEWFHAFDNYHSGWGKSAYTATPALQYLWETVKALPVYKRSRNADKTRSAKYYSRPREACARAFEAWVVSRVCNDYLVNILSPDESPLPFDVYPYATPDELPALDVAMRRLFCLPK